MFNKIINRYRVWKEKRLRKKIILRLLSNPNYEPDDYTANLTEHIVYYINNGVTYLVE